jgi:LPXTG-site transpeptidase (sortase) family protein
LYSDEEMTDKKIGYAKLAFVALMFIYCAKLFTGIVPAHIQAESVMDEPAIETIGLTEAISMANTYVAVTPERLSTPTKNIEVKGKTYIYNLVIPSLGVNVGVHGMGLTNDGKMAVPDNFTEVGWYSLGYRPGEIGSAVMGAHVDNGGKKNGVFKNLKHLKIGESMYVGDGDGNIYHYKVTARKAYPYRTAITSDVFLKKDAKRLNLITCYGTWLPSKNTYDKRLVVSAELVEPTAQ